MMESQLIVLCQLMGHGRDEAFPLFMALLLQLAVIIRNVLLMKC